jgi:hypothetical protein
VGFEDTKVVIRNFISKKVGLVWIMVFNATFNNIPVVFWRLVLLVEETRVNHEPVAGH